MDILCNLHSLHKNMRSIVVSIYKQHYSTCLSADLSIKMEDYVSRCRSKCRRNKIEAEGLHARGAAMKLTKLLTNTSEMLDLALGQMLHQAWKLCPAEILYLAMHSESLSAKLKIRF